MDLCQRRIGADWLAHFNQPLLLLETFVDTARYRGTVYRAGNWTCVGQTRGHRRIREGYSERDGTPKWVFVRALKHDAQYPLSRPLISGNRFAESEFWTGLFNDVESKHGTTEAKGVVAKLRMALANALNKMMQIIRGRAFDVDGRMAEHLDKVRAAVKEGFTAYEAAVKDGMLQEGGGHAAQFSRSPKVQRTIADLVAAAESQKDWKNWYQRHEATLSDVFGGDADLFQKILSATSQATGVKGNVTLALKAYDQLLSGKPFQGFLPAVIKNLERIRNEEALSGAKISQYGKANEGDTDAIAVDRHIAMLFFNTKTPSRAQIFSAKVRIRKIAERLGWEPRQVQAALWAYNQVRLGTDPAKVQSYDTIIEARAEKIAALRSKLGRGEAGSVRVAGAAAGRAEEGQGAVRFSAERTNTETAR